MVKCVRCGCDVGEGHDQFWHDGEACFDALVEARDSAVAMIRRLCDELDANPCETTENKVVVAEARALADELEAH